MAFALVLSGGTGARMGGETPKQFLSLGGKSILRRTLEAFSRHLQVEGILLVAPERHLEKSRLESEGIAKLLGVIPGGETRQQSAHRGLAALQGYCVPKDIVLIHDGARPLVDGETITRCIDTVVAHGAANTVVPSENTILLSGDGRIMDEVPPRGCCYTVQTPQGFYLGRILAAHQRYEECSEKEEFTDDCALYAAMTGERVHLSMGKKENIKITTPADLLVAEALLKSRAEE